MRKIPISVIALSIATVAAIVSASRFKDDSDRSLPVYGQVAPFVLTTQDETPLSHEDLKGKVWVANFIFTSCHGPCPLMSQKMRQLQIALGSHPSIRFISVSVDPDTDSPEVLRKYAKQMNAGTPQWSFLTGKMDAIIGLAKSMMLESGNKDPNLHSTRFIVVDPQGKIRAIPDSQDEHFVLDLKKTLDELLEESRNAI